MIDSPKIPISVVVPVKNEESGLSRCLERLRRFAEVIVVDSGSADGTLEIANRMATRLLSFQWDGKYPKKRNWLLLNHKLACDWVLFLDADELVDDAFCDAAAAAIASGAHNGYWLNYTNHFLGRPLRHGVPQRKLALFRIGRGLFERIDELSWSRLDMEIHEHPIIEGSVGEISAKIEHNDDRGLAKFIDRHRDYALWEARRVALLQQGGAEAMASLTDRQRFKYRHLHKWWYPAFYFFYAYVVKTGFRDGAAGFYYAFYKAWYFLTIRLIIAEGRLTTRLKDHQPTPDAGGAL